MRPQKIRPKKEFNYPDEWPPEGITVRGHIHTYLGFGGFTIYGEWKVFQNYLLNKDKIPILKSSIKSAKLKEITKSVEQ